MAQPYDLVVLHIHPDDVVPTMAFSPHDRCPPILLVNHADHVFWVGVSIATLVMNLRSSGMRLATARRGVLENNSLIVPRPLFGVQRLLPRAEAKRRLGLLKDDVVAVSVASASKFAPIGAHGFLDLVTPPIASHPKAFLLVAGPSENEAWRCARLATAGRIRALGRLSEPSTVYQAADIYLDSYPFSSLTSLLEAGRLGAPLMTFRGYPE